MAALVRVAREMEEEDGQPLDMQWGEFKKLPEDVDEEVRLLSGPRRGFGSVRVEVSCGSSTWSTSVFPSADGFVLPLKAAVRRAELLEVGSPARFTLRLL